MGDLKFARSTLDATRSLDHGGNIYRAREISGKDILDFSANINPLGLPPHLKNAIRGNLWSILHYPDPDAKDLTRTIAQYWKIDEENVLVGNGSIELIFLTTQALRPKRVLIPSPTFSEYERSAKLVNANITFVRLREKKEFSIGIDHRFADSGVDSVFLCNPNNPTANLLFKGPEDILTSFRSAFIIVDEAFMDFLPDERDHTSVWEATRNERLIVLRTLTKFFALPGLRLGYLVATKKIVKRVRQFKVPWSVNSLAQVAGVTILNDPEFIERTRNLIARERAFLIDEIGRIGGLKPYPSVTNFLLIKIARGGLTSSDLQLRLLNRGILIRNCGNFRGLDNRFFRIAVRTHGENCRLLKNLRDVCKMKIR